MWEMQTIAELCSSVTSGGTPRRDSSANFQPGTVPWIKTAELLDTDITGCGEYISPQGLASSSAKVLPTGTVLMAMYGATVGQLGRLTIDAACNQAACAMIPDPSRCDSRWLFYALRRNRQSIVGLANGAAQQNLNASHIKSYRMYVPPLPEQRAIAEVLGALDDKIAVNSGLVTQATDLAQAITRRAIEGGDLVSLSSLASITMGSSPKGTSYNETGEGAVLYQGMRDFGTRFPTPRVWTTDPVRTAGMNDVLVSVRAPVGTLNRASEPCCIGRGLAALETSHHAALYHLLLAQQENFSPFNSDGTIFGSISKPQLSNLPVKVPRGGLSELDAVVAPVEDVVGSAIQESKTLAQLRDTLLPALMDGTLRVKDAILHAEEVL